MAPRRLRTDHMLLYKHQVLATRHMPPWHTMVWLKFIEMVLQTRPKALYRTFFSRTAGCVMPCYGTARWAAGCGLMKFWSI